MRITTLGLALITLCVAGPEALGQCQRTLNSVQVANNQGNNGGAMYFDLEVRNPILVSGFDMNYEAAIGTPVGLRVHSRAGTHVGFEASPTGWTQVGQDNGGATSAARNGRTSISLATPISFALVRPAATHSASSRFSTPSAAP